MILGFGPSSPCRSLSRRLVAGPGDGRRGQGARSGVADPLTARTCPAWSAARKRAGGRTLPVLLEPLRRTSHHLVVLMQFCDFDAVVRF
jgi:hypothetical protein